MEDSGPSQPRKDAESETPTDATGVTAPTSEPHGALFLVIYYLNVPELLAFQCVCRSLRDAIAEDTLVWRDIRVEPPLCWRLTDNNLRKITSRASGTLRSLCLLDCWTITEYGLQSIVFDNPSIVRLCLQGCTQLTPEYVVSLVISLTNQTRKLKQLRLYGINSSMPKEMLEILKALIQKNCPEQERRPMFYNQWRTDSAKLKADWNDDCNPIDIDICPICDNGALVFDCTKETCRSTNCSFRECRGCIDCISRCVECGNCLDFYNLFGEETICSDLICLPCWLLLPKCNTCNKPFCRMHMSRLHASCSSDDFTCERCQARGQGATEAWD